ncbi:MAG: alpha/beta hydrolase [Gordonia sp. (in: high G+C Gram-positive bacteria)]
MTTAQGPTRRSAGPVWEPDHLLDHYQLHTFDLGPDPDGEDPITATLIRKPHPAEHADRGAVLYLHGFTDYFFHEPLAEHFAALGYAFYALDLRKCGRSRQPQHTAHFTTDLRRYDLELGLALDAIDADLGPGTPLLVAAHSTGGLVAALWLDRLRRTAPHVHARCTGLILNSPWFDMQGDAIRRSRIAGALFAAVSAVRPTTVVPLGMSMAYGESLHAGAKGEWSYDLDYKPMGGFPVTFGFLHAIRTGQLALHRGIDVGVPALVLRSDKTVFSRVHTPGVDTADAVLDVDQIARWSGCLGNRVTAVPIVDARHDVFLSVSYAREHAYAEVDAWLSAVLGIETAAITAAITAESTIR